MKDTLEDESVGISDRVEIISTEDQKIKAIGEILSADSSREILKILFNDSLTANQIAQKTEISLPLVIYHLKKMQESGVVKITNVGKNTKSHDMKFYTVDKLAIIILPSKMSEPAKKSKSLFNSFTRIHRLATLGGVTIAAWFSSQLIQKITVHEAQVPMMKSMPSEAAETTLKSMPAQDVGNTMAAQIQTEPSLQILWSIITVLSVIVTGLIIEVIISRKHSRSIKSN
ncbi:MAG TPA: winged helix-turn-helix domain-containing protein [Nitrosarchaeum sp.]|jgi:DNA-binding transcriptional regulator LsrR (DeoR family)|nr:winged helix-turn-helix domain-containing protein [Nitrosarchaeum sp.]